MKDIVNITVNPKGGVGKSFTSAVIACYHLDLGINTLCIDTDPTTRTFSTFKALKASRVPGIIVDNEIDKGAFDDMMEKVLLHRGGNAVIDTGASGFVPFMSYMIEGEITDILHNSGRDVIFHIPVTGGQAQQETLDAVRKLVPQLPEYVKIVIWVNEYFGKLFDGKKDFKESDAYKENKQRITSIVTIAKEVANTSGKDIKQMLENHMTFTEAFESPIFRVMQKSRLHLMRSKLYAALDPIFGFDSSKLPAPTLEVVRAAE